MIVYHNQIKPPLLREPHKPGEVKKYPVSWVDRIPFDADIAIDSYILPVGFTLVSKTTDVSIIIEGQTFAKSNIPLISVSDNVVDGIYLVQNKVTTTGGQTIIKDFLVKVEQPIGSL